MDWDEHINPVELNIDQLMEPIVEDIDTRNIPTEGRDHKTISEQEIERALTQCEDEDNQDRMREDFKNLDVYADIHKDPRT